VAKSLMNQIYDEDRARKNVEGGLMSVTFSKMTRETTPMNPMMKQTRTDIRRLVGTSNSNI